MSKQDDVRLEIMLKEREHLVNLYRKHELSAREAVELLRDNDTAIKELKSKIRRSKKHE